MHRDRCHGPAPHGLPPLILEGLRADHPAPMGPEPPGTRSASRLAVSKEKERETRAGKPLDAEPAQVHPDPDKPATRAGPQGGGTTGRAATGGGSAHSGTG